MPVDAVRIKMEHRLEDKVSHRVRYEYSEELVLSLVVPSPLGADELCAVIFVTYDV